MFAGPSIRLFRALGFSVGAHWSLLLALGLAAFTYRELSGGLLGGVALAVLLFGSVLLHELGHAVVARRRGVPISGIDLHFFGGVAKMEAPPRSPGDEVAIAIAGPVVSLALGAILLLSAALVPLPDAVTWLGAANLVVAAFNVLPALPLDGGRVLRALLAKRSGLLVGTRRAVTVSRALAIAVGVLGAFTNPWLIAMAVLVWTMGSAELRHVEVHHALSRMGYRSEWARYDAASRAGRPVEPEVLDPDDGVPRYAVRPPVVIVTGARWP